MSLIGATSILTEEHVEGNFSLACCLFNFFFISKLHHSEDRTRMYSLLKPGMGSCKQSYIQQSFIDSELFPASVQET